MEALNHCLQNPPFNTPDAIGKPFSNARMLGSFSQCFGRTVVQVAITTVKLTYNFYKLAFEGLGAGIGGAAGFVEGGARIAATSIGEHFGWCRREPKTLSEFTIKGMKTGADVGEIAGHVIGMPAALATTVVTAPLNLLYCGLPNALDAGLEVKRKGSSTRSDEKINQHILNFNKFIDNACKEAHIRLHGNEESLLDQLRQSLRDIGPVPV